MTTDSTIEVILVFASPFLLGGIIALINNDWSNRMITRFSDWIDRNYHKNSSTDLDGWISLLLGLFFWLIWKPISWTNTLNHHGLKSGIRVVAMLYSIFIIFTILYVALIIVISILALYLLYKILMALLEKSSENGELKNNNDNTLSNPKKVKNWFWGDHTEHYNQEGKVIYTSKEKEGLLGNKYTEYYGSDGERFATTSKEKSWYGAEYISRTDRDGREERHFKQYGVTEYQDKDGKKNASDRECEDFFGDEYTEHCDKDGFVEGTSREKMDVGFFRNRKYIEYRDNEGNITEIPIKE